MISATSRTMPYQYGQPDDEEDPNALTATSPSTGAPTASAPALYQPTQPAQHQPAPSNVAAASMLTSPPAPPPPTFAQMQTGGYARPPQPDIASPAPSPAASPAVAPGAAPASGLPPGVTQGSGADVGTFYYNGQRVQGYDGNGNLLLDGPNGTVASGVNGSALQSYTTSPTYANQWTAQENAKGIQQATDAGNTTMAAILSNPEWQATEGQGAVNYNDLSPALQALVQKQPNLFAALQQGAWGGETGMTAPTGTAVAPTLGNGQYNPSAAPANPQAPGYGTGLAGTAPALGASSTMAAAGLGQFLGGGSSTAPTLYSPGGANDTNPNTTLPVTGSANSQQLDPTANPGATTGDHTDIQGLLENGVNGQGAGSALQDATQNAALNQLNNPSPYGSQDVKDLYSYLEGNIDDQYALQQKALGEDASRRGLGNSTIYAGNLNDLNIGKRSAQESLGQDLATNYAQTLGQYQSNAINQGNTVGSTAQQNQQNWLAQLMGYGQQAFNNDTTTNAANQSAQQSWQNYILQLLGAGYSPTG